MIIEDCKSDDQGGECVNISLALKTPKYQVEVGGFSQNGLRREGGGSIPGMGDLSQAYQTALEMVMKSLPDQVQKVLKR